MRALKPETEIRNLKRELARVKRDVCELREKNHALSDRAYKATNEAEAWRRRFDTLLARDAGTLVPTAPLRQIGT